MYVRSTCKRSALQNDAQNGRPPVGLVTITIVHLQGPLGTITIMSTWLHFRLANVEAKQAQQFSYTRYAITYFEQ